MVENNSPNDFEWAANAVTEPVAIRSALVHGVRRWPAKPLDQLSLVVAQPPPPGTPLKPGVGDIFRYKRAVRAALNGIRDLK